MSADPFRILRIDDMLLLVVEVVNLRREGARLVREDPGAPALVLLTLPSQHTVEGVLFNGGFPETVPAFAAGESMLVFLVPDDRDGIDLSVGALLDWNSLNATTVPFDQPRDDPNVPAVFGGIPRTAIEFPTGILLGHDDPVVAWSAPLAEPAAFDGRAELWHVELHGENGGPAHLKAFARAPASPARIGMPLDPAVVPELVSLTSDDDLVNIGGGRVRRPLRAEQFMLTPLGATARISGAWDLDPNFPVASLTGYEHVAALGRDQFVHTVRQGFLSSGHRASCIDVTTRRFDDPGDGTSVAYLHKQRYIRVDQPEVAYGAGAGYGDNDGRQMPFASLRLIDQMTPPLSIVQNEGAFWVEVNGTPLPFHAVATDAEGRHIGLTLPLVFAYSTHLGDLPGVYNDPGVADRTTLDLGGQAVALAKAPPDAPGTTGMPVTSARIALVPAPGHPAGVLPAMVEAVARVPAVEQLTGCSTESVVRFNGGYLANGIDGHPTGAFLDLAAPVTLSFSAAQAGGVARPNTTVQVVTAHAGLVARQFLADADPAGNIGADTMAQIFGGAKLLGPLDLSVLLADVGNASMSELPGLDDGEIRRRLDGESSETLPVPIMRVADLAEGSELRYVWKPALRDNVPLLDLGNASLVLEATTRRVPNGPAQSTVRGELRSFAFRFDPIVRADFDRLTFTARPGAKPEVTAAGVAVTFLGDLEFVNALRDALPADVFGPGAFVDVNASGVVAGYSLTLPTLSLGMFNLSNVVLAARLTIPFDDAPTRFRFSVSERHNPFNVSVSLFGGGGFFALEVSTRGIELVEGAIEFGGSASLDLGVASGGVHLMAGIAFRWAHDPVAGDSVTLTGYVRCGGYLSVLGIVTISVEFHLALTYHKDNQICEVVGQGSVTVSVRVAFFSKSVTLALERRFTGSAGDPSFADCVEPDDWDEYCLAFAA